MASGAPLRILCLDGGGVKGLSSLYIVKELMAQTKRIEATENPPNDDDPVRPCDYFDIICGTGTGGLIAIMLGRLQYDVDTAIKKYAEMTEVIFGSSSPDARALFDHTTLENEFRKVIIAAPDGSKDDAKFEDPRVRVDPTACHTFVLASRPEGSGNAAVRMRTYGTSDNYPFRAQILQVARATSAAPTYFLPIDIEGARYGDGRTGWNNPTAEAINEADYIWPRRPIGCLVSIGTGLEDANQLKTDAILPSKTGMLGSMLRSLNPANAKQAFEIAVAQYCVKCATSCQRVHEDVSKNWARFDTEGQCKYMRLNVAQGMAQIGLQEWKRLHTIAALTFDYMESSEVRDMKRQIAKRLLSPTIYLDPASSSTPVSEIGSPNSNSNGFPRLIEGRRQENSATAFTTASMLPNGVGIPGASNSTTSIRQPQFSTARQVKNPPHNRWKVEELESSSDESGAGWSQYFQGTSLGQQPISPLAGDALSHSSRSGYLHPSQMPRTSSPSDWVYPKRATPSTGQSRAQSTIRSDEETTFNVEVDEEYEPKHFCDYTQCRTKDPYHKKNLRDHFVTFHCEDLIKPPSLIPNVVSGTGPRWWRCWSCLQKLQSTSQGGKCDMCNPGSSGRVHVSIKVHSSHGGLAITPCAEAQVSTNQSIPTQEQIMSGGLAVDEIPEQDVWAPPPIPTHWTTYTPASPRHIIPITGNNYPRQANSHKPRRAAATGRHPEGEYRRGRPRQTQHGQIQSQQSI